MDMSVNGCGYECGGTWVDVSVVWISFMLYGVGVGTSVCGCGCG